jgi:hypothetical protein
VDWTVVNTLLKGESEGHSIQRRVRFLSLEHWNAGVNFTEVGAHVLVNCVG